MRYKVELSHKITVVYNWFFNPDKDTLSSLSEKQAKELCYKVNEMWECIDRRNKHTKPNR